MMKFPNDESPFHENYSGDKTDNLTIRMPLTMKRHLVEHLTKKYQDDASNSVKRFFEEYMDKIAFDRKTYDNISWYGLVDVELLKSEDNPPLHYLFHGESTDYFKPPSQPLKFQAHKISIDDFCDELVYLTHPMKNRLDYGVECLEKEYPIKELVVLEFALNNYLDNKFDSCYCKGKYSMHMGVNLIRTTVGARYTTYTWDIDDHFPDKTRLIKTINFVEPIELLELFDKCGNRLMKSYFETIFESDNVKFPQKEIDRQKKQLESNKKDILRLEYENKKIEQYLADHGALSDD